VDVPVRCADFVRRVGFLADNRRFFAANLDGTVRVWSLPSATGLLTAYAFNCGRTDNLVVAAPQGSRTFSPDGRLLAQFGPKGVEVRRRTGDKHLLWRLPGAARWARFTSDGSRLITANMAEVDIYDALTGRQLGRPISPGREPRSP
jgi:hypothetical protein